MRNQLIFTAIICLLAASPAAANINKEAADYLVKRGKESLKNGDQETAIHEFSKALLIKPEHEEALGLLRELGFDEGLYPRRTRITDELGQKANIKSHQEQYALLEEEKRLVDGKLLSLRGENELLNYTLHSQDKQIGLLEYQVQDLENAIGQYDVQLQDKIRDIEAKYAGQKEAVVLVEKPVYVPAAPTNLAAERDDYDMMKERLAKTVEMNTQYEQDMQHLSDEHFHLKMYMQNIYNHQEKNIHVLEDYLALRDEALYAAQDDLVTNELDKVHTQNLLLARMTDLVEAQQTLLRHLNKVDHAYDLLQERE